MDRDSVKSVVGHLRNYDDCCTKTYDRFGKLSGIRYKNRFKKITRYAKGERIPKLVMYSGEIIYVVSETYNAIECNYVDDRLDGISKRWNCDTG